MGARQFSSGALLWVPLLCCHLTHQAERKRKKAGAAVNHAKMAEKLLQAQLRREALRVAHE